MVLQSTSLAMTLAVYKMHFNQKHDHAPLPVWMQNMLLVLKHVTSHISPERRVTVDVHKQIAIGGDDGEPDTANQLRQRKKKRVCDPGGDAHTSAMQDPPKATSAQMVSNWKTFLKFATLLMIITLIIFPSILSDATPWTFTVYGLYCIPHAGNMSTTLLWIRSARKTVGHISIDRVQHNHLLLVASRFGSLMPVHYLKTTVHQTTADHRTVFGSLMPVHYLKTTVHQTTTADYRILWYHLNSAHLISADPRIQDITWTAHIRYQLTTANQLWATRRVRIS